MIKIENMKLEGSINSISSKSMAHRHLICATLADTDTRVYLPDISDDIQMTINCLIALGAELKVEGDYIHVNPVNQTSEKSEGYFDAGESGTTLRFMLPIATSLKESSKFVGRGRLPERPLKDLTDTLVKGGCKLSSEKIPFKVSNKLRFKDVNIAGNISSQYISGLLLASPLQREDVHINIIGRLESKPYVDMTVQVMREFGIPVYEDENCYYVPKSVGFKSPKNTVVEGDWSNSAFFLVAGAIGQKSVEIKNLNMSSLQGDMEILNILKHCGATVNIYGRNVKVVRKDLRPMDIDMTYIPDLLPILTVLAAGAVGSTRFYNAHRLRLKESDRIKTSAEMIRNLGGVAIEGEDELIIEGSGRLKGGEVDSFNDHRIAMASAIASIICKHPVFLSGEKAVNKSYYKFFDDFKSLGGKICHL